MSADACSRDSRAAGPSVSQSTRLPWLFVTEASPCTLYHHPYCTSRSMTSATMTTAQHQRPDAFCSPPPPACTAFSIVVDDVDANGAEDKMLQKLLADTAPTLRKRTQCSESKEDSDARIKQIQVEAESRKVEFARLLEEHAQVIRKLKQMEEDGAALGASHA
ncbi:uncharacterized protein LOC128983968 [Macrosteles quadrilineatus]|uniref:uncharacterized protein LOC128983968 n=1 Tax=Macrosteles quadrilineatus TaxID=74068 RepID=UPI0023E1A95C|nr:uncharacterized protein LOC128983968 [Macrosteles quadrilineatus]